MRARTPIPALLIVLAACIGERPDRQPPSGTRGEPAPSGLAVPRPSTRPLAPASAVQPPPPEMRVYTVATRPAELHTTIPMEGFEEPFTLRLYKAPDDYPLAFSTYVPPDMLVEGGDDGSIAFVANFAGKRNPDAALRLFPDSLESDVAAANLAREYARAHGLRARRPGAPHRFTWSIAEYDFAEPRPDAEPIVGTVAVAGHDGRYFRIVLSYPEDYAEGFTPRAVRILEEWRWADGAPLGGGAEH
ncbi:MAG: hypothetical protein IRZ00_01920 [Gemmatimonadetes bacterium]|nr:hypothetical protein [Gemmatimonadota bacterium]